MTRLRELFEVYPAEPRATMPIGLRVDDSVYTLVDGADPLTGEVTSDDSDRQMRAGLGKLMHVIASAGFDLDDLDSITAYLSPDADLERVAQVWDAARPTGGRFKFQTRTAPLAGGRKVVIEAICAGEEVVDPAESIFLAGDEVPAGVKLGPVLYVPALTAADATDGSMPGGGIGTQVRGAFDNLERLFDHAGIGMNQILRIAGYMRDLKDKDLLNDEMVARFPEWSQKPVHKYVPSALPPGVEFALQAIAVEGDERRILEIEGIKHNDPISLGARAGNVFVSSRVQARLEATAAEQAARLIESHARRLVEHIGGSLDDVSQMVWGIGDPEFEAPVREECDRHWQPEAMPRLDVMLADFPHSPLPRLEFFALLHE